MHANLRFLTKQGRGVARNLNYRTNNSSGSTHTFSVDVKNQLTNATPVGLQTYDDNGNVLYAAGSYHGHAYDDENRLVRWYYYGAGYDGGGQPTSSEDWRTDLVYDGLGRLRQRVEYEVGGLEWWVWSETYYIYDGMRVIQERSSGSLSVSYTRGSDLSGTLEGAGGIGGLLARSSGSTHSYYHADGGGNITYLVNSSQGLAASYKYDAYGNLVTYSGSMALANVYRFSSKEQHAYSGLYYYGYRWYAPNLQRWLNRDPLAEAGFETLRRTRAQLDQAGPNLYVFVGNNPINSVDPHGLLRWPWWQILEKLWEAYKMHQEVERIRCTPPEAECTVEPSVVKLWNPLGVICLYTCDRGGGLGPQPGVEGGFIPAPAVGVWPTADDCEQTIPNPYARDWRPPQK